jgi:hypothetical protein
MMGWLSFTAVMLFGEVLFQKQKGTHCYHAAFLTEH